MHVRPGRLIAAAACCAAAAAVPVAAAQAASTGGTLSTAPGAARHLRGGSSPAGAAAVRLTADPGRPTIGQEVRLTVSGPSLSAAGFAWDLSGTGVYRRHTVTAQTAITFTTLGIHSVAVRFAAGGHVRLGVLTLTVAPRPAPRAPRPAPRASRPALRVSSAPRATIGLAGRVTAHVAGDPRVTVADFHFSPATTTIHAGDTISWSNNGPSSHTATARGGAFDTGMLKKGQSASHTFTQPGTFTYFCQIHTFMHGTIVVLAATTATTTSTTAATGITTTPTAAAQAGPTLPNTGFNALGALFAGVLLLGLGAGLRRTRARESSRAREGR